MKLIKIGCGCTLLVVHEADTLAKSTVRLIDYCGDSEGIAIGPERILGDHANLENLAPDKVTELPHHEAVAIFDGLAKLVNQGYKFQDLQRILKSTVAS